MDFVRERESTKAIRADMKTRFTQGLQFQLPAVVNLRQDYNVHSPHLGGPPAILEAQPLNVEKQPAIVEGTAQKPSSASFPRKAERPPTCDCPKEMHAPRKSKASSSTGDNENDRSNGDDEDDGDSFKEAISKSRRKNTKTAVDPADETRSDEMATKDAETVEDAKATEATAKTCRTCQKYKKPPKGKKIAWRQWARKWMYVHKNSPDEEVAGCDEDDEEALQSKPSSSKPAFQSKEQELGHNRTDNSIQSTPSNGERSRNMTRGGNERLPCPVIRETGPEEVQGNNEAITDPDAQNDVSQSLTEQPAAVELDCATHQFLADTPPAVPQVEDQHSSIESRREVTHLSRVDVDLTIEDDKEEEPIIIKSETSKAADRKSNFIEDCEMEDLQYKLDKLGRRKRMLEIEEEEAEIRRKLAKRQHATQKQRVKEEIKIED